MIVWGAWKNSVSKEALKVSPTQPTWKPYCIIRNREKTIHIFADYDSEGNYIGGQHGQATNHNKADRSRKSR